MKNLDITLRMILACEAEATNFSIDQSLVMPTLKIVLGAISGELSDNQITSLLEKIADGNQLKNEQLADFANFYRSVVDTAIFYLDLVDEKDLSYS